jgi:uncharacterized small protein (DUF1192 family)
MKWFGHNKRQCVTALVGVKELLDRIAHMNDEQVRKHTCDSAKEIINNLLRESK